ncbi:tyrosine-type recombinase/integrase [Tunturiibacter gelidoferens]|uniref:Integrase n=1 Tax=Tunturiibacter lichenicola TaxID=2051959 RepID=A0A7Y9NLX6_9BACT|nr:tyrosine-type recombinase/integrase [Edaphobacter lichenicola]NYF51804.1 integrase [Edaphobacter lichenicola]
MTPEEVRALFRTIPGYARVMVVVAAVTGLRRGELVGLKWEDIDFHNGKLHVRRSLVDQKEGLPKTQLSKKPGALEGALAFTLKEWSQQTSYSKPSDWVFASPYRAGRTPYWPGTVLEKVIQPAAREAGITKTIGWQPFGARLQHTLWRMESQ